jgi:hypothetical protein
VPRQRLSRLHLLLIVTALTLLVFSARSTWTQERPSGSKTPTQLSNAAQVAAVPEAEILFHPAENLSLPFAANHGQAPSQARFTSGDIGYYFPATENNTLPELWQLAKIDVPQAKANHFIGNAPTEWLTNGIPNTAHYRTPDPSGDVAYYGHRIPWAGRIILSLGEQAKIHPRATRVLWLIDPHLRFENRLPRPWIGK